MAFYISYYKITSLTSSLDHIPRLDHRIHRDEWFNKNSPTKIDHSTIQFSLSFSACARGKSFCVLENDGHPVTSPKNPQRGKNKSPFFYKTDFCNDFHSVILKSNSLQPKEPFGLQLHSDNGWSSIQGGWQNAIGVIHCCFPLFTHFFLSFDSARSKRDDHPTDHVDGSEILHLGCFWKPVNNWINYLSTGAGFLPSTPCHMWFIIIQFFPSGRDHNNVDRSPQNTIIYNPNGKLHGVYRDQVVPAITKWVTKKTQISDIPFHPMPLHLLIDTSRLSHKPGRWCILEGSKNYESGRIASVQVPTAYIWRWSACQ